MKKTEKKLFFWQIANNIFLFILLIFLSFTLPRLIPGSPIISFQEDMHVLNSILPDATFNRFEAYYAPTESLWRQFIIYIRNIINFDLGYSFYYGYPVIEIIKGRIGWTLLLSLLSISIASFIAIPLGVHSALSRSKRRNKLLMHLIILLQAVPIFIVALLMQRIFAYNLGWFPSQGAYSIRLHVTTGEFLLDAARHMVLPLIASVIGLIPSNYLLTRNIILRIKEEPYVQLAYYNNINQTLIKYQYILRNALPEIISKLNIHFVYAIAGTLFVEMIFSYPGIGALLQVAVSSRDYPLIQGIFICIAIYAIIINLCFEWILHKASPRVSK